MALEYDREFGKRLRQMRKYRRLVSADVAGAIGIGKKKLFEFERGEAFWDLTFMMAVCRHLDVSAAGFLDPVISPWKRGGGCGGRGWGVAGNVADL